MHPATLAKHLATALVTYLAVAPFLWPLLDVVERPISGSLWVLVVLSATANVMVLTYHHVVPAHPKFLLIWWRRALLHVHIASGSLEFLAGVAGCALGGNLIAGRLMAITALLFHVPSAYAQTPSVFGSRAIMRPSYLLCIGLHAFCAVMLLLHPTSLYWTVATFLLFNTYVWVRVFFYLLDKFGLFEHAKYTVAVVLAGLTTTPAVLGETAMLAIAIGWAAFIATYTAFFVRTRAEFVDFVREHARDSAFSEGVLAIWQRGDGPERDLAREFFDLLDVDKDGTIEPDELEETLSTSGIPTRAVRHFMESRAEGGRMPFEAFITHLWTIPEVRRVAREVVFARGEERSERDKAAFVFERLDLDGNGSIDRRELEGLLSEWSLPRSEVSRWMRSLGLDEGQDISFDVFFEKMRPIWRFIFYNIIDARYGSRNDLIERVFSAWRDDAETKRIADDLRTNLLRTIPFLQGLDDAAIEQLAACFVEEEHPAGEVLFEHGDAGDDFYIVRSGTVVVRLGEERLATLRSGDWLGEGALLARRPRSADAVVEHDAVLLRASSASFDYLLERRPDMRAATEQLHAERQLDRAMLTVRRELLRRVPFLQDAPDALLEELAHRMARRTVEGEVLRQGLGSQTLYLLSSGSVGLYRDEQLIAELPPGAFFGEGGLVDDTPRSLSVIADPGTVVYALSRADFNWLTEQHPEAREQLLARREGTSQQAR